MGLLLGFVGVPIGMVPPALWMDGPDLKLYILFLMLETSAFAKGSL